MFIVRVREGRVEIGAKGSVDLDNLRLVRAGRQPRIQLQDTCGDTWQHELEKAIEQARNGNGRVVICSFTVALVVHESVTEERVAWRGAHALKQRWKQWYGLWEMGMQASAKEMARAAWHTEQMRRRDVIPIPAAWCERHAQGEAESMDASDGDDEMHDDMEETTHEREEHQQNDGHDEHPTEGDGERRDPVESGSLSEAGGETRRLKQAITAAVREARQAQAMEQDDGRGCFGDLPTRRQNARWRVTAAETRLTHHLQTDGWDSSSQQPVNGGDHYEEHAEHAVQQRGMDGGTAAHLGAEEEEAHEQHAQPEEELEGAPGEEEPEQDDQQEVSALQDKHEQHGVERGSEAAEAAAAAEQQLATAHEQQQDAQLQQQAQQQQHEERRGEEAGRTAQDGWQQHGSSQQQLATSTRRAAGSSGAAGRARGQAQEQHKEAREPTCAATTTTSAGHPVVPQIEQIGHISSNRSMGERISLRSANKEGAPPFVFIQQAGGLLRERVEGVFSSTAGAIRRGWAWAQGILRPPPGGGGDSVAAPAPRWGEGGASAGTPLPGDRSMVAPEDTTAHALPQKRYRND